MEGPGGNAHGVPQRSIFSGVYTMDWPWTRDGQGDEGVVRAIDNHGREIDELVSPLGGPEMDHYTTYGARRLHSKNALD
eukprot:6750152-Pyramimonas_sp.AAC.1